MIELKTNVYADGMGFLYRAAFSLAKGDAISSLAFLKTAEMRIQTTLTIPHNVDELKTKNRYWAEKILDEYTNCQIKLLTE